MRLNPILVSILTALAAHSAYAADTPADASANNVATQQAAQTDLSKAVDCSKFYSVRELLAAGCDPEVEYVQVRGRYIGPEAPEIAGRYHLSREFIERAPKTTGDINELIALMPGVQLSESALSAAESAEIRAKELSISGGQPWQTGFFLDGVNYNNRIDPASYNNALHSINDVRGASQSFIVNSQIVQSIDVYDSNIPVKYGDFSGGVVDAKSRSAFDFDPVHLGLTYRSSRSSWGHYHVINELEGTDVTQQKPIFNKDSYGITTAYTLNKHHGFLININYLESEISELSLSQLVSTTRNSTNFLVKYSQRDLWLDNIDLTVTYAPYEDHNLLRNQLNSKYLTEGGGFSSNLSFSHQLAPGELSGKISYSYGENSRTSPQHHYIWLRAQGKDWGKWDSSNTDANGLGTLISQEGGYGSIEKIQQNITAESEFKLNDITWLNSNHQVSVGAQIDQESVERTRFYDSYAYKSARQYSSNQHPLQCNGNNLNCVELSFFQPLSELEALLGEPLNFSNPDHIQLYQQNIASTPQYFELRQVYPKEYIDVSMAKYALYLNDSVTLGRLQLNLGLRYSTDEFFKNHNISPRLSGGYDLFDDGDSLITFGTSRYYDAGLLTYKIRETQLPYYSEYRPVRNGIVQSWLPSSADSDVRYRYENVKTPFNDEIALGFKQATRYFGTFSIKGVKRWQKDQLAAAADPIKENGYRYSYQTNTGKGYSERLSLAWNIAIADHSFWMNTSFSKNQSNANSYEEKIDNVPIDELVYFNNRIVTKSELNRVNTNFSRPLTLNFGWNASWTKNLDSSLSGTYVGSYETARHNGNYRSTGELTWLCPECASTSVTIPVYEQVQLRSRVMLNLSLRYQLPETRFGSMRITADISNLMNSRTYLVSSGANGIETGRQFWLGIAYDL